MNCAMFLFVRRFVGELCPCCVVCVLMHFVQCCVVCCCCVVNDNDGF